MNRVEQKDRDILIIDQVQNRLSEDTMLRFVISGSYSIESLTHQHCIAHNDIDSDVFTEDISTTMAIIPALLVRRHTTDIDFSLYKITSDRIEYDVSTNQETPDCPKSRLEIHVIPAYKIEKKSIILNDSNGQRLFKVDLTEAELIDSTGKSSKILVKSLAYSIATWALRISDAAQNQLRPVKQSDIESFLMLLNQRFKLTEVLAAMESHPQMPVGAIAQEIYISALIKAGR